MKWIKRSAAVLLGFVLVLVVMDWLFFMGSGHPPPHLRVPGLFPKVEKRRERFALIINGAIEPNKNHPRYWNNTSLFYCTLKRRGWDTIHVLQSDGHSPQPDRVSRSFMGVHGLAPLLDSPLDLDHDGNNDVRGPATKEAISESLALLGKQMGAGDCLVVALTDHGQLRLEGSRLRSVAMLWGEEMTGTWFGTAIEAHVPATASVLLLAAQCHGALFLDEITRDRTVCIAPGWPLWIWSDQDYSVFPYHFCGALLQKDPATGSRIAADENGDGTVTFGEAFVVACRRDHVPEWPQRRIIGKMAHIATIFR